MERVYRASNVHMKNLYPEMLITHTKETILRPILVLVTLSVMVCRFNLI
jgi:hypothetical protein